MKKLIVASAAMVATGQVALFAATGEVTLSGSTWTGKVDGTTVFTGSSMAAAANACVNAMSSGTIHIRNSGNKNGVIQIKSNITIDGNGVTISGGGTATSGSTRTNLGLSAHNKITWVGRAVPCPPHVAATRTEISGSQSCTECPPRRAQSNAPYHAVQMTCAR